jgi:mycothiol synthase
LNNNLIFRFPGLQDTKPVFDLMSQCDIHEFGEADSSMEDLLNDWNNISLKKDAWLLLTPEQNVIGYAAVIPWGADYKYDLNVDPTVENMETIHALLSRCEERSARLAEEQQKTAGVRARCYVAQVNQQASNVLEQRGFQEIKYIYNMQARFDEPPPPARLPDGISVRNPIPGQDDQTIYEVIQSAFERPGRTRQSFEDWKGFMLRADIFKPELWFLAMRGEEMVGACLCYQYSGSDQGWVRQLGVLESVRRTGLGSALLHHAFNEFYKRGFRKVGLAVESENLRAIHFYENVGMKQTRCYVEYSKEIAV